MRAEGEPIVVQGGHTAPLKRIYLGGADRAQKEAWLQDLIQKYPQCLPLDQIEPGLSAPVPICTELPTKSGYIDNFMMTPEGDIIIVEVKLWRNSESRREVIAQALDYATCLFKMNYSELEQSVLKAETSKHPKPGNLYDFFGDADTLEEPAFIDAVNSNLRNGRITVIIAADGIRSELETITNSIQHHAGFHFTLALVELAVYEREKNDEWLVIPRTLAQTYMIERGIVRISEPNEGIYITSSTKTKATTSTSSSSSAISITSEQYYEAIKGIRPDLPEKLRAFMDSLSELGVYPEYKRSLNIKWDPPGGKPITLAYILRNGQIWTDTAYSDSTPNELVKSYINDQVKIFDGELSQHEDRPYLRQNRKSPRIENLIDRFDAWRDAIARFQDQIRKHEDFNV